MKSEVGLEKLRGGYYTPEPIARFICNWAIDINTKGILEPSCGDGIFLKEAAKKVIEINPNLSIEDTIVGIELFEKEAKKASIYGTKVIYGDFFGFYKDNIEGKQKFDVIIGNPPFIRYQNVDTDSREIAFQLMRNAGLHPNKLTNIWLPF